MTNLTVNEWQWSYSENSKQWSAWAPDSARFKNLSWKVWFTPETGAFTVHTFPGHSAPHGDPRRCGMTDPEHHAKQLLAATP